jgi:uncharacterized membrane protein (DUF373 family)
MGMDGMLNLGLHEWKVTRLMFSIWLILLLVVLFCVARVFVYNHFGFHNNGCFSKWSLFRNILNVFLFFKIYF